MLDRSGLWRDIGFAIATLSGRVACPHDEEAMTQPLTAVERRVYEYLIDFTAENTFQPSIREIGRRFQIRSTKTVSDLLQSLAAKGFIERDASRSRGVRLLGFSSVTGVRPVPYYGRIHAGEPALLPEHRVGFFTVDRRFLPNDSTFMLRVNGDSMAGAGILDGDYVLVDPAREPAEGEIVVVRVDEGSALKRLASDDGQLVLSAGDPAVPDERIPRGEPVGALGVVCGVFRALHDHGAAPVRDLGQTDSSGVGGGPSLAQSPAQSHDGTNAMSGTVTAGAATSLAEPARAILVS